MSKLINKLQCHLSSLVSTRRTIEILKKISYESIKFIILDFLASGIFWMNCHRIRLLIKKINSPLHGKPMEQPSAVSFLNRPLHELFHLAWFNAQMFTLMPELFRVVNCNIGIQSFLLLCVPMKIMMAMRRNSSTRFIN